MKLLSNYITLNIFIIFVLLYRQHTSCVRALARMYLVSPGTVTAGEQLGIMCNQ